MKLSIRKSQKSIFNLLVIRLFIVLSVAFFATTTIVFFVNTNINNKNYQEIITSTLVDIERDIENTSDINMLELASREQKRVEEILTQTNDFDTIIARLKEIHAADELSEINIVNADNIIYYSSVDAYINFDMDANADTKAFDTLNHGAKEIVQPVRPTAYSGDGDYEQYNKYAGLPLQEGGYIQVGISADRFQKQIDDKFKYIAMNRHIGQTGYVIISNSEDVIVSSAQVGDGEFVGLNLTDIGLVLDKGAGLGKPYICNVKGEDNFCIASFSEGYYIIGIVPMKEVQSFRNVSAITNSIVEIVIFLIMFLCISLLINKYVVSKLHNVNKSLGSIIDGQLNTTVDEYSSKEFSQLSTDINSTVAALKEYTKQEQERLIKEIEFARNIQISALPKVSSINPYHTDFELNAAMYTAKEVGGDFYDFYSLRDNRLAFLVADVSGKGVPAAMFMMICKTMLKNLVESGLSLEDAFTKANDELCESNDEGMFVTVWMGILNLKTGQVDFVDAGHNPPLLYKRNGEFAYLSCKPELVLTGMPGLKYKRQSFTMKPGDKLFLYTDGVTEAHNSQKELYGESRLLDFLNANQNDSPGDIILKVKDDIDAFAGEMDQFDDITMLTISYLGSES